MPPVSASTSYVHIDLSADDNTAIESPTLSQHISGLDTPRASAVISFLSVPEPGWSPRVNVTMQWLAQSSVAINLGERRINLATDAIAIVVEMNQHIFKNSGVAIDLSRSEVIVNDYETLYNVRISLNAPTIFTKFLIDRSTRLRSERLLRSYAEVIKTLATRLNDRFCVIFIIGNRRSKL